MGRRGRRGRRGRIAAGVAAVFAVAGAGSPARGGDPPVVIRAFGDAENPSSAPLDWGADLDGDGHPDLLATVGGGAAVRAYSGRTGTPIRDFARANDPPGYFGACAWIGDLDADGVPDVLVGAHGGSDTRRPPGAVLVFSGASGTEIYRVAGIAAADRFGDVIEPLGDVSGDGVPDFAVSAPGTTGVGGGAFRAFSGADGQVLAGLGASGNARENLGRSMVATGDFNRDRLPELFVGVPNAGVTPSSVGPGRVDVLSTATGQRLRSFPRRPGAVRAIVFGYSMAAAGDVNLDGLGDVVVGGAGASETVVLSGANGATIRRYPAPAADARSEGTNFTHGGGDADGDGIPDVLSTYYLPAEKLDVVLVHSGARTSPVPLFVLELPGSYADGGALVPDADGDGLGDLLVSGLAPTVQIVKVVPQTPPTFSFAIPLTRAESDVATGARGTFAVRSKKGTIQVTVAAQGLSAGTPYGVFLETGPSSGAFTKVGDLTLKGASGALVVAGQGTPPAALGIATLADLAGRRVVLREANGDDVLSALLPFPSAPPGVKSKLPFLPVPGSPFPAALGTASLAVNSVTGAVKLQVVVRGVPAGTALALEVEDAPGSSAFAPAGGAFAGTKWVVDTGRGDPLPGGASSLAGLRGRAIRVLAGATPVLAVALP